MSGSAPPTSEPAAGADPGGALLDVALALGLACLVALAAWSTQEPTHFQGGRAWDAEFYLTMAEQVAQGRPVRTVGPFVFRLGTPAVVGRLFPGRELQGFAWVNGVACLLAPMLLMLLARLHLKRRATRLVVVGLWLASWVGPARYVAYRHALVDPWAHVVLLAGLLLLERRRSASSRGAAAGLALVVFLGVIQKEMAMVLAVASLVPDGPDERPGLPEVLPLVAGLVAMVLVRSQVTCTGDFLGDPQYSFLDQAAYWLWTKSPGGYLLGLLQAFGPVLALVLARARRAAAFLDEHRHLAAVLVMVLGLAFLGGNMTERLAFFAAPVVLLLAGVATEAAPVAALPLGVLLAFQAVAARVFWTLPEHGLEVEAAGYFLTPLGSRFPYLDLYGQTMPYRLGAQSLVQHLVVLGLLVWLLRRGPEGPR